MLCNVDTDDAKPLLLKNRISKNPSQQKSLRQVKKRQNLLLDLPRAEAQQLKNTVFSSLENITTNFALPLSPAQGRK